MLHVWTGDGSTGHLPVDANRMHYLTIFSHVYHTINLMDATAVPTHSNTVHLVQFKDQHMLIGVEPYRWIYDGRITGCNYVAQ